MPDSTIATGFSLPTPIDPHAFRWLDALEGLRGQALLQAGFDLLGHDLAIVSSFGADSAVLLAMVAEIDASAPVLFLETGRHFPETIAYRQQLAAHLGLTGVRDVTPDAATIQRVDPEGLLASFDPDRCCDFRKVRPLEAAVAPFSAWVTGRRRSQAVTRANLPFVEPAENGLKLNPLADWTPQDIEAEFIRRDLPRHPLQWRGYASIGCAPCTRAIRPGEESRAGRWSGKAKTECGIHLMTQ